jgi:hypothetical protein
MTHLCLLSAAISWHVLFICNQYTNDLCCLLQESF